MDTKRSLELPYYHEHKKCDKNTAALYTPLLAASIYNNLCACNMVRPSTTNSQNVAVNILHKINSVNAEDNCYYTHGNSTQTHGHPDPA
jgi:hypothetical protein